MSYNIKHFYRISNHWLDCPLKVCSASGIALGNSKQFSHFSTISLNVSKNSKERLHLYFHLSLVRQGTVTNRSQAGTILVECVLWRHHSWLVTCLLMYLYYELCYQIKSNHFYHPHSWKWNHSCNGWARSVRHGMVKQWEPFGLTVKKRQHQAQFNRGTE